MDWKKLVEKKNAETFVLPEGWDSRDKVAEQLECSPDRVDDHLRPAIKAGEVIKETFKVWDDRLKRNVMTVAYSKASVAASEFDIERAKALKAEGKSYAEIGGSMGVSGDTVRSRLRRLA